MQYVSSLSGISRSLKQLKLFGTVIFATYHLSNSFYFITPPVSPSFYPPVQLGLPGKQVSPCGLLSLTIFISRISVIYLHLIKLLRISMHDVHSPRLLDRYSTLKPVYSHMHAFSSYWTMCLIGQFMSMERLSASDINEVAAAHLKWLSEHF